MKILDLGCNDNKYSEEGCLVIGLDIQNFPGVDVVHDLEKPLPFLRASFGQVRCTHTIEHIFNVRQLFSEVRRVLKPNGTFIFTLPHRSNPFASYFGHHSYWNALSFDCLADPENDLKGFELVRKRISLVSPFSWLDYFANRFTDFYEWRLSWLLPAKEIEFKLVKTIEKNPDRNPFEQEEGEK